MSQIIEVDSQEVRHGDVKHSRTSSEPEHHSGSEASKNSTRSIGSSDVEEFLENDRRYCGETYFMPNDDTEQTRLAIAHQAFLLILDGQLTLAHIPRTAKRILDIGTGTGDWAIAVAERLPKAEIIATDITNAHQPASGPPNVSFELDDAQNEWAYNEPFDFIHMRCLAGAFSDWNVIYAEVSKHLRRGGTFEIMDYDMIQLEEEPANSNTSIFNGAIQSAADKAGTPLGLNHLKKPLFDTNGLSVVKTRVFKVPLGVGDADPQKRVAGKMAMISALEGLEAVSLRLLTKQMGWKVEDVKDLCKKVQEEVMKPNAHAFLPCQFVVARKLMF